ncbi:hypothetical protein Peur_002554 [Populus x canadensis]
MQGGYSVFYARNTIPSTPKVVNDIHKRGGTILETSRGGHDKSQIVDSIQDLQVCIIGGDGTQKGFSVIFKRCGLCCLLPKSPFYLDGAGGLFEYIKRRLKENGHMVIVIAEGAGQELLPESILSMNKQDV